MPKSEALAVPLAMDRPAPPPAARLKFTPGDGFDVELRRRVDAYFESTGQTPRDIPRMYFKTAVVLGWMAASYVLLVFFAAAWWQVVLLALSLGLAVAAVGFNVQHDGNHRAYSNHRWVNRLAAMTLDLLGGSSYVWSWKHNSIHHSYANITGHDDDVNLGPLGRLTPHQPRRLFHGWQHFYLWILYGFLPVKWHWFDDFFVVAKGRIGEYPFPRPTGWDLVTFITGRAIFFTLALVIPVWLHPLWVVLLVYAAIAYVEGVLLAVVFQLAHCVEEAEFPMPALDSARMPTGWAAHQVQTTVDFARKNRWLSWYIGGLNFQIEHHLFPQVCHLHYASLAPIVEQTCKDFGLRYASNPTFLGGVASHYRWLRRMGRAA